MASVRQLLQYCILYLTLISLLLPTPLVASTFPTSPAPHCSDICGNITIPYPFGTRPECCRDGFNITCDNSTTPPKALLGESNIEVLDINITTAEARVLNYIGWDCYNNNQTKTSRVNSTNPSIGLESLEAFLFSNRRNKFTVIGCYTLAYISGNQDNNNSYSSGCASFCNSLNSTTGDGGSCNGLGCCQTSIPVGLNYYYVHWGFHENPAWSFNPCSYAALVQEDWYNFTVQDLQGFGFYERNKANVPIVLDWAIRDSGTCQDGVEKSPNPACLSKHSGCNNTANGKGYICQCLPGYEGNPYLPADGCTDTDECKSKDPCKDGTCINREGSYDCACPKGTNGDGKTEHCTEKFPKSARVATYCILGVAILVGLCFLVVTHQQHKRRIKEKEEYQKYYQMMDNHLHVFSKKQIENATNNFDERHVLGAGGQGKVYKGLLESNQVVAIKKAKKEVEETQRGEFVNEILLLSTINHKNIVRLLGCCLEVKIPMLVYEFIPSGTLFDLLHEKSKTKPISLATRLKIALESAMALDYLHCSISQTILHGDVKSANILLDADFSVKISDFGASSVVPLNEIVELVHFSHGYLDPECMYTNTITKKSDVYSFGVVILEIVTRKEAVYLNEKCERESLATCFLSRARKNEHPKMLDVEIVKRDDEKVMEVLEEICMITVQCLSPNGEDRPTMRQVVEELQRLVRFHSSLPGHKIDPKETDTLLGEPQFFPVSDVSDFHSTEYSAVLEISTRGAR